MTNPFELPKDLLHEVIIRTIEIDNLSNEIIRVAFGLELDFGGEEENWQPLNLKEINRFNKFFLEGLGSSSRAELLLNVVEDICKYNKIEMVKIGDFKKKLIDFYKIRNIFAHNIYPKDLKGFTRLESSEPLWGELNNQHKQLFEEIKEFLMKNCYKEVN
jgi:hypothetical protein